MAAKMPNMDWKYNPVADSYKAFKARMLLYFEDTEITDEAKQATKIKLAIGDEGMRRVLASGLSTDDQKKPKKLWDMLEAQVDATVKISFRVHRLEFSTLRQKPEESLNDYMSRLREKATKCKFEAAELEERLIEMVILSTPFEDFRKELLTKQKGYAVKDVLERGRDFEAIQASQASLNNMRGASASVNAITKRSPCTKCGLFHAPRSCPAYGDTCHACGGFGHWKKLCRSEHKISRPKENKPRENQHGCRPKEFKHEAKKKPAPHKHKNKKSQHRKAQHEVYVEHSDTDSDNEETYSKGFYSLKISDIALDNITSKDEAFASLIVHHDKPKVQGPIRLKIDTGSGGNTLPLRTYKQMFGDLPPKHILQPEKSVRLTSYSGHSIPCMGSIQLGLQRSDTVDIQTHKFYVVDVPGPAIIGLQASRDLHLISMDKILTHEIHKADVEDTTPRMNSVSDLKWWFPDCFDKVGCFKGEAELHLREDAKPHIDPPRRCAIHLRSKIESELQRMEADGIIRRVTGHTDWCSSITYATKQDGSLRICLDPKKLNEALKRCPHKIPTIEEINPTFAKAKYFTKLDAKAGYWSVKLKESSQELTTFRTPFGRYCFQRLPFGLSVSQDIFQQKMDDIIDQCDGVVGITDDIVVCGETEEEHDKRLYHFLQVAREEGLVLNSSKCEVKKDSITFFGRKYTSKGMFPDPEKVEDIIQMPTPQDKQDLQRFIGMVTFLSPHLPKLSDSTAILRDLLKETVPFEWSEDHHAAFQKVKELVATGVGLQYYDPSQEVSLEVDASMCGLGATLVQADGAVAFASKALTTAQSHYSNLERECLAIVHGIQRFHHYLYGRHFQLITDHKPLEMILRKPLCAAPPRLQRMLVKIQGYDYDIHYRPGSTMVLADTLSRLPNQQKQEDIELDCNVDNIEMDLLNFSPTKQEELRKETSGDPVLHALSQTIFTGWPDKMQELPPDLRSYWSFRDELAVENGIVFKGRQVVIPTKMRGDILKQLHEGHQGIEKTRRLARESVYWPKINSDIEQLCKTCGPCQEMQPQQPKQPMRMHERPNSPWTKLGTDLFEINQKNYLIISDYYSRYPVVKQLETTTARAVIAATKETFSLLGVPKEIISDNGPQFQREYDEFCDKWGIEHNTSSPRHAQSNGFIERQIRYIKPIVKKCLQTGGDIDLALLNVRATPLDGNLPSPAELMFGRAIPTTLPSHSTQSTKQQTYGEHISDMIEKQKEYADQHTREQAPLLEGQHVRVLDKEKKVWYPAKVIQQSTESDRSYIVETESGRQIRRNRVQLRGSSHETETSRCVPDIRPAERNRETERTVDTHQSAPKACSRTSADPPVKVVSKTDSRNETVTRSGRVVKLPSRFDDSAP